MRGIVRSDVDAEIARIQTTIRRPHGMPAAAQILINHGQSLAELAASYAKYELARQIDLDSLRSLVMEMDLPGVGAGLDDEVVLEVLIIPVIDDVDAAVYLSNPHLCVLRNVRPPLRWIVSDEVVALRFEHLLASHAGMFVRTDEFQPHGCRSCRHVACPVFLLFQNYDCFAVGEEQRVITTVRGEAELFLGLLGVFLEAHGPSTICALRDPRRTSRAAVINNRRAAKPRVMVMSERSPFCNP